MILLSKESIIQDMREFNLKLHQEIYERYMINNDNYDEYVDDMVEFLNNVLDVFMIKRFNEIGDISSWFSTIDDIKQLQEYYEKNDGCIEYSFIVKEDYCYFIKDIDNNFKEFVDLLINVGIREDWVIVEFNKYLMNKLYGGD